MNDVERTLPDRIPKKNWWLPTIVGLAVGAACSGLVGGILYLLAISLDKKAGGHGVDIEAIANFWFVLALGVCLVPMSFVLGTALGAVYVSNWFVRSTREHHEPIAPPNIVERS